MKHKLAHCGPLPGRWGSSRLWDDPWGDLTTLEAPPPILISSHLLTQLGSYREAEGGLTLGRPFKLSEHDVGSRVSQLVPSPAWEMPGLSCPLPMVVGTGPESLP